MRVGFAYIFVVLLWATTPLAIKWSGEGSDFLFAVTARMSIGSLCLFLVSVLKRQGLAWHRSALMTYLAISLQIYGSMLPVYWAAQYIPSGWISLIFGLSPLITAVLAAIWLAERSLSWGKVCSYLLGIGGLAIMFGSAIQLGREAVLSIATIVFSALLQCLSAVWVKRIDAKLPAMTQISGGLLVSMPLYWGTWGIVDGQWPTVISPVAWLSIAYLGIIATTAGFALYYFLLGNLSATRVALITLVSPALALWLGHSINHEPLSQKTVIGSLCILAALLVHTFSELSIKRYLLTRASDH